MARVNKPKPKAGKARPAGAERRSSHRARKANSGARQANRGVARRRGKEVEVAKPIMRVRELDPRAKIGPGTGVQRLFRVDAVSSSASETHLVFLDRHGLYCEHGKGCPAVLEVTKLDRSLKRTNQAG